MQIQTEALRVLSCAFRSALSMDYGSAFPFSGNDCLDSTHRELNSTRKLIAGVLWPIPMNAEERLLV